jgi:hypothetical protein
MVYIVGHSKDNAILLIGIESMYLIWTSKIYDFCFHLIPFVLCDANMLYYCVTDINECDSNPCVNGGTCVNRVNSYACTCVGGYIGTNCQTGTFLGALITK